jgi:hypothetical protein
MRFAVALLTMALVGGGAVPATARTFLFLHSTSPDDWVGQGETRVITEAQAPFIGFVNFDNGVRVWISGGSTHWNVEFAAAGGVPLAPGAYENAQRFPFNDLDRPGLSVTGDGHGCNELSGRFDVLEVTYGQNDDVLSFAADFVQYCETTMPPLYGSIRFRAGDAACGAAPDGTACDDHDPCTASTSCQQGTCVDTSSVAPCAVAPCAASALCDPHDTSCHASQAEPDGTQCDDGDPCTLGDSCQSGYCVSPGCSPSNGACTVEPSQCWNVTGKVKFKGPAGKGGGDFSGGFSTYADSAYELAGPLLGCGTPTTAVETGELQPAPRGRSDLIAANAQALMAPLGECLGGEIVEQRRTEWIAVKRGGTRLTGTSKTTSDVFLPDGRVAKHVVTVRLRGTPH